MSILLPMLLVSVVAIVSMAALYAVATRNVLQPATVEPFAIPAGHDPSADTLPTTGSALLKTAQPATGEWKVTTIHNLTQVEDFLDSLEAHGVTEREILTLGDSTFAIRWR